MASDSIFGKGIVLASGFDLSAKSPLDTRSVVNTIAERDEHELNNRAYAGMTVYVIENETEYRYNGYEWVKTSIDLSDVHTHENKEVLDGISLADINRWNAKSDFSGSYLDLTDTPTIPTNLSDLTNDLSLATEAFVTNKIAEAKLDGADNIDLSGYATKDELKAYVPLSTLTNYVTHTDLEAEDYADKTYVDNKIADHDHTTMTETDAEEVIKNIFDN